VGLEPLPKTGYVVFETGEVSPSHTVGLEQTFKEVQAMGIVIVSIPHSGLRTPVLIASFRLSIFRVSIPHSGLRTL